MVEMTPALKELFSGWTTLTMNQKNILLTIIKEFNKGPKQI